MAIRIRHDAAGLAIDPKDFQPNAGGMRMGIGGRRARDAQGRLTEREKFALTNMQRMQDRMFDLGKMNLANRMQVERDARMMKANQDMFKMRQEAEDKQFMERRKFQQEDMEAAIQRDMLRDSTKAVEGRVADVRGMLSKQQYTPEGKKIYGDLFGALRSIEAQRDNLRPKEYNELLNKWLGDAEKAGLENFIAPPPSVDDTMASNFKDLGTGYGVFLQPDGKLDVREIDPTKAAAAKGGGSTATISAADYFADDSKYDAAKKKALAALQQRYLAENPNAESEPVFSAEKIHQEMMREFNEHQKFLQSLGGSNQQPSNQQPPATQSPPPTSMLGDTVSPAVPQQPERPQINFVETGSDRRPSPAAPPPIASPDEQFEQHLADEGSGQTMPATAPNPATNPLSRTVKENFDRNLAGMYAGPRDEAGRVKGATIDDLKKAISNHPEMAKGGVDEMLNQLITPEALEEMAKTGESNPQQALVDYYVNLLTPDMPKQPKPVKATELKDPIARTQSAMLPRPGSAPELVEMVKSGKLKPGDMFIAPDGTMQRYTPASQ